MEREHLLRKEAEEQVRALVEGSPTAILTADGRGVVLAANNAANELFAIEKGQTLQGRNIQDYLPVLADALRLDTGQEPFRTAAQCRGRRQNGEIFLAHTWFSSYMAPEGKRLAAIAVDSSEEMRDREEQNLRQLLDCNRIATAAISHEIRNFCGAISLVCSSLQAWDGLAGNADFAALSSLVSGLQQITSLDLQLRSQEMLEEVRLQEVLDNLRIVIGPDWQEIDGAVHWRLPPEMPTVSADPHGLLQAFLNLARNSRRAVQECSRRELNITVSAHGQKAIVRFQDSGPGIAAPDRLFQPFQPGASSTGLGLFVSRAIIRTFGGELHHLQPAGECSFVIEIPAMVAAD
jgi:PAS domain S-box-containing protein